MKRWMLGLALKTASRFRPHHAWRLCGILAGLLMRLNADSAKTTRINLQLCFPEMNEQALAHCVRSSLQHMAMLFFEFAYLAHWSERDLLDQIETAEGAQILDDAYASGSGVLLLVPHFGNWELLCAYLGVRYTFAALYDPPKIAAMEPVVRSVRQRFNGEMFPIDTGGMRSLLKVLRRGDLVAVLPDQVPDRNAGVHAPFFEQPALTMTLTHKLLERGGVVPVMGAVQRVWRADELRYRLMFRALPEVSDADPVMATARAVNGAIEQVVKEAPEQYQWEYKRFKRPPKKGKHNVYRRQ